MSTVELQHPNRNAWWVVYILLVLVALLCELAAMSVALDWFDGNILALLSGGLAAYFGAVFLNTVR